MAKDINVNSVEWCDLIFEGKNKDYGAYELRKHSPRRHLTAYVVIIGCVVLAMVLPAFVRFLKPVKAQEKMVTVTELSGLKMDLPEVKEENKIVAVNVPPPPTLKMSVALTKRPFTRVLVSALIFLDSYRMCLSYLRVFLFSLYRCIALSLFMAIVLLSIFREFL